MSRARLSWVAGVVVAAAGAGCAGLLGIDGITFVEAGAGGGGSAGAGRGGSAGAGGHGGEACHIENTTSVDVPTCVLSGSPLLSNSTSCRPDPPKGTEETFSDLEGWCSFERELDPAGSLDVECGSLVIRTACSSWEREGHFGPYVYRHIEASNFALATRVTVTNERGEDPSTPFHSAGLLTRLPLQHPQTGEDRVAWSVGRHEDAFGIGSRITVAGFTTSNGFEPASSGKQHKLGLCRRNHVWRMFRDHDERGWIEVYRVDLPNLGGRVQVGAYAQAGKGGELLAASFEYLRISELDDSEDCADVLTSLAPPDYQ
jgi:hypothetical protein